MGTGLCLDFHHFSPTNLAILLPEKCDLADANEGLPPGFHLQVNSSSKIDATEKSRSRSFQLPRKKSTGFIIFPFFMAINCDKPH